MLDSLGEGAKSEGVLGFGEPRPLGTGGRVDVSLLRSMEGCDRIDEVEGRLRRSATEIELSSLSLIADGRDVSEDAGMGVEAVDNGKEAEGMVSVSCIASGDEVGNSGLVNKGARRGGETMEGDP